MWRAHSEELLQAAVEPAGPSHRKHENGQTQTQATPTAYHRHGRMREVTPDVRIQTQKTGSTGTAPCRPTITAQVKQEKRDPILHHMDIHFTVTEN